MFRSGPADRLPVPADRTRRPVQVDRSTGPAAGWVAGEGGVAAWRIKAPPVLRALPPPARCTTRHAQEGILQVLFHLYPPHPAHSRQLTETARNPSSWASTERGE